MQQFRAAARWNWTRIVDHVKAMHERALMRSAIRAEAQQALGALNVSYMHTINGQKAKLCANLSYC